jgi:hypothetical protein
MASERWAMRLLPNLLLLSIGPGTELPWRLVVFDGAQNCLKTVVNSSSEIHIDSGPVHSGRCTNRQQVGGRGGMKCGCWLEHSEELKSRFFQGKCVICKDI